MSPRGLGFGGRGEGVRQADPCLVFSLSRLGCDVLGVCVSVFLIAGRRLATRSRR